MPQFDCLNRIPWQKDVLAIEHGYSHADMCELTRRCIKTALEVPDNRLCNALLSVTVLLR